MTDRRTMITSTQAGLAFPLLARFLAEQTTLSPPTAEDALRAACNDYGGSESQADTGAVWKRAVDDANASIGVQSADGAATAGASKDSWSCAVETANRSIGAI